MSVHRRKDTGKYVVKWREGGREGRQASRSFDKLGDARAFDREVQRLAQLGHLAQLDAGKVTLSEWVETWWSEYAIPNLNPGRATSTRWSGTGTSDRALAATDCAT